MTTKTFSLGSTVFFYVNPLHLDGEADKVVFSGRISEIHQRRESVESLVSVMEGKTEQKQSDKVEYLVHGLDDFFSSVSREADTLFHTKEEAQKFGEQQLSTMIRNYEKKLEKIKFLRDGLQNSNIASNIK